jgi:hypothetical protein
MHAELHNHILLHPVVLITIDIIFIKSVANTPLFPANETAASREWVADSNRDLLEALLC